MSLPKIKHPTFELKLPSTGEYITYRPFLVKEEKILLIAKESGEGLDVYRAIRQVVQNCVVAPEDFDAGQIAAFDLDYLFIKIRANSVGNIVEFKVEDSGDGIEYDLSLDLNDVEVSFPAEKPDPNIPVTKDISIKLKYPSVSVSEKISKESTVTDINVAMIKESIELIFNKDDAWKWSEATEEEKNEFIESIPAACFHKIQDFFINSPKIEYVVKYVNSQNKEKKVIFRTLDDFFELA